MHKNTNFMKISNFPEVLIDLFSLSRKFYIKQSYREQFSRMIKTAKQMRANINLKLYIQLRLSEANEVPIISPIWAALTTFKQL